MKQTTINWIALLAVIVGGINLGALGLFNLDLISFLLGPLSFLSRFVFIFIGACAVYVAAIAAQLMGMKQS
ncbi:DUF378 domain-containing protein [Candidatus Margulisiibacteriota bacterium]